jgi:hypothetical protein
MKIVRIWRKLMISKYRYVTIALSVTTLLGACSVASAIAFAPADHHTPLWVYVSLACVSVGGGILTAYDVWYDDTRQTR